MYRMGTMMTMYMMIKDSSRRVAEIAYDDGDGEGDDDGDDDGDVDDDDVFCFFNCAQNLFEGLGGLYHAMHNYKACENRCRNHCSWHLKSMQICRHSRTPSYDYTGRGCTLGDAACRTRLRV